MLLTTVGTTDEGIRGSGYVVVRDLRLIRCAIRYLAVCCVCLVALIQQLLLLLLLLQLPLLLQLQLLLILLLLLLLTIINI